MAFSVGSIPFCHLRMQNPRRSGERVQLPSCLHDICLCWEQVPTPHSAHKWVTLSWNLKAEVRPRSGGQGQGAVSNGLLPRLLSSPAPRATQAVTGTRFSGAQAGALPSGSCAFFCRHPKWFVRFPVCLVMASGVGLKPHRHILFLGAWMIVVGYDLIVTWGLLTVAP